LNLAPPRSDRRQRLAFRRQRRVPKARARSRRGPRDQASSASRRWQPRGL